MLTQATLKGLGHIAMEFIVLAVFIGLLIALIGPWVRTSQLRVQVEELRLACASLTRTLEDCEWRLERLETRRSMAQPPAVPVTEPSPEPCPAPPLPTLAVELPSPPADEPRAPVPEPAPLVAPPPVLPPPPEPSPLPDTPLEQLRKSSGGWEALIGGSLLNKLGALVLVIGVALFLSYSWAHLGPAGRASTALTVSACLLAAGVLLEQRERYRAFSRGILAAGWASLYLTSYAVHALPAARVIHSPFAGVLLMVAVACAMVWHSVRYRVQSLTALTSGCVFAALALSDLSTFVSLALIVLAVSLLFLARRFAWDGLALFASGATYVTFLTRPDSGAALLAIQAMLLVYWVLFESFDWLRIHAGRTAAGWPDLSFAVNAAFGLVASAALWHRLAPEDMWVFCSLAAGCYLISTCVRLALEDTRTSAYSLTLAAVLAGSAIVARSNLLWQSLGLLLEAEVLFLAGHYLRLRVARWLSLFGFAVWFWPLFASEAAFGLFGAQVHEWTPPVLAAAAIFYLNRFLVKDTPYFSIASALLLTIVLGVELPWRFAGTAWLAFGFVLFELGLWRRLGEFRYQGYALLSLGGAGTALRYLDPEFARVPWTYAIGAAASLAFALRARWRMRELEENERSAVRLAVSWTAAVLAGLYCQAAVGTAYSGLSMILLSLALLELSLWGVLAELAAPALALAATGLCMLLGVHAPALAKYPPREVSLSFSTAALSCLWLTGRLLRRSDGPLRLARMAAPWPSAALCWTAIWMLLPDAWLALCLGIIAMAWIEIGVRLDAADLTLLGRFLSVAALAPLASLTPPGLDRVGSMLALSAIHAWLGRRLRDRVVPFLHAWTAFFLLAALVSTEYDAYRLVGWSALGLSLILLGHWRKDGHTPWMAASLALASAVVAMVGDAAVWQRAIAVSWFAAAVPLERQPRRAGYGLACSLVAAVTLWREAGGGVLTLSWGLEGILLLATGFTIRERSLRLCGLALLLTCIGKVFFYDLRHLEAVYRILSFIGLGLILLGVSWFYTRFRDTVQKYL